MNAHIDCSTIISVSRWFSPLCFSRFCQISKNLFFQYTWSRSSLDMTMARNLEEFVGLKKEEKVSSYAKFLGGSEHRGGKASDGEKRGIVDRLDQRATERHVRHGTNWHTLDASRPSTHSPSVTDPVLASRRTFVGRRWPTLHQLRPIVSCPISHRLDRSIPLQLAAYLFHRFLPSLFDTSPGTLLFYLQAAVLESSSGYKRPQEISVVRYVVPVLWVVL